MQPAPSTRGRRCGVCAGCLAQDCGSARSAWTRRGMGGPANTGCQRRNCEGPHSPHLLRMVKRKASVVWPWKRGKPAAKAPVAAKLLAPKRSLQKGARSSRPRSAHDGLRLDARGEAARRLDARGHFVPQRWKKLRRYWRWRGPLPLVHCPTEGSTTSTADGHERPGHVWNQNELKVAELTGVATSSEGRQEGRRVTDVRREKWHLIGPHTGCLNKEFPP